MSEREQQMASEKTNGDQRAPVRKEPRQISFRVSEDEYTKLQQSAATLDMSVPVFVKKKAQGSRLVTPKLDADTRQTIVKQLSRLGNNANQIARYCHQHREEAPDYEALERNITTLRKELSEVWQQLK